MCGHPPSAKVVGLQARNPTLKSVFYICQRRAADVAHATMPHPAHEPVPVALLLPAPPHHRGPIGRVDCYGLTDYSAPQLVARYTRRRDHILDLGRSRTVASAAGWLGCRTRHDLTDSDCRSLRLILARQPYAALADGRTSPLVDWMAACHSRLQPGGFLICAVASQTAGGRYVEHATSVIAAARAAGMIYHQHLITVHRPLPEHEPRADQSTGGEPPPELPAGRHPRLHTDLYAFRSPRAGRHA